MADQNRKGEGPWSGGKSALPDHLMQATDRLAARIHEVWADRRESQGWRLGPHRDDEAREHPGPIPFDQLPESERQLDRDTAIATLRALLEMGFRVEPPSSGAPVVQEIARAEAARVAEYLAHIGPEQPSLGDILAIWRASESERAAWPRFPDIYRNLALWSLRLGEPLLAYDAAREGGAGLPGDLRLRQFQALALARSGAQVRASELLDELVHEGNVDSETLGLMARTSKDQGLSASSPSIRDRCFRRALRLYLDAFRRYGDHWTGINAATLAMLVRDRSQAIALAAEVEARCLADLKNHGQAGVDTYYKLATLGEAALIQVKISEAENWYSQSAEAGRGRHGDITSTRRNARLLANHLGLDQSRIDAWFHIPTIVVFVGHMIDRPDRKSPRFPRSLEPLVASAIRERLRQIDGRIGYSSAACGSDILFLEAIDELGQLGEVHAILPYEPAGFVRENVDLIPGGQWKARFERLLGSGSRAEVISASSQRLEIGGISYDFANMVTHGLATIRAEQLDTSLKFLAVWDGRPGDGPGGTAHTVARWRALGHDVEVIDLREILQSSRPGMVLSAEPGEAAVEHEIVAPGDGIFGTQIMAILFGDVVGFSKLSEAQITQFVQEFLGMVDRLLPPPPDGPLKKNTWGDGLYFAFESVAAAGRFALDLCERVSTTRWATKGLPSELDLRIGLHAGPVYNCIDPVTKQPNSLGSHVSRAARIEPITPPGQVYASREFAALAAAEGVEDFKCHYIGMTPYAKGYGIYPTYHVHRGG